MRMTPTLCKNLMRALVLAVVLASGAACAQSVAVHGAWVRATVAGQNTSGVFMTLVSAGGARVIGASTPVASLAEVHETVQNGNVVSMRPVPELALPAGRPV